MYGSPVHGTYNVYMVNIDFQIAWQHVLSIRISPILEFSGDNGMQLHEATGVGGGSKIQ